MLSLSLLATSIIPIRGGERAHAASNNTLNFQARILQTNGAVVPDGSYNVRFKIYSGGTSGGPGGIGAANAGSLLWTETWQNSNSQGIDTKNGYISAALGSITAFSGINWDQELWITMDIGGTSAGASPTYDGEMLQTGNKRMKVTGVPYAIAAGRLQTTDAAGTNTSSLSIAAPTGGSQVFQLQDQTTAGTYNLALLNGNGTQTFTGLNTFSAAGTALTVTNNASIGGTLGVTGLTTATGGLTTGTGSTLTVGGATLNNTLAIGNLNYTGTGNTGSIGSAASTVDIYTNITIAQTTAGQTLTIPAPTTSTSGRVIYITNIGSSGYTMAGAVVSPGVTMQFVWNSTTSSWSLVTSGVSGSYIQNGTAVQTANFNIQSNSTTDVTATIQGANSQSANILDVKAAGVGSPLFSVGATGDTTIQPSVDSATALVVKNAAGSTNLLTADTAAGAVSVAGKFITGGGQVNINTAGAGAIYIGNTGYLTQLTGGITLTTNGSSNQIKITDGTNDYFKLDTNLNTLGVGASGTPLTLRGSGTSSLIFGSGGNTTTLNFTTPSGANTQSFQAASGVVALGTAANSLFFTTTGATNVTLPTTGTLCSTTSCSTAGAGYVLNQSATPGTAQTGNINMTGTIIGATLQGSTSVLTPLLDAATASTALNIGTTNANQINLNKNTAVTGTLSSTSNLSVNTDALFVDATNKRIGIGQSSPAAAIHVSGNQSTTALSASGIGLRIGAGTYTDTGTAASGTVATGVANSFGIPTIAASNTGVTYTNAATLYIAGAPTAGTNVTITNPYALYVSSGNSIFGGNVTSSGGFTATSGTGFVATTATANALSLQANAPSAASNASLVRLGNAITSGSANGTFIGVNAGTGFTGDLIHLEVNNSTAFNVNYQGNVNTPGSVTAVGVNAGAGLLQGSLGLTVSGAAASINNNSNFNTSINTGTSQGNVTIGNNGTAGNTVTIDAGSTGGVNIGSANTPLNINSFTTINNAGLLLSGTLTTASNYKLSIAGTLNSSVTTNQYGFTNQMSFTPTGASLSNLYGLVNIPKVAGSSLNITNAFGSVSSVDTTAGYTGTIGTATAYTANDPTIGGSNLYTNFYGYNVNQLANNSGNTSGTITNVGFRYNGATTAAAAGGTLNSIGVFVTQPSGAGAGTTNNYGIFLQGAGGGSSNYSIYNNSGAKSFFSAGVGFGTTSIGTNAIAVSGTSSFAGDLTVTSAGNVAFQRNTTDITVTGAQTDLSLGGTGALYRFNNASALTINTLAGGTDGRIVTLVNAGSSTVTLVNNGTGTAANKIITGTGSDVVIPAGASLELVYDNGANVWRVSSGAVAANGAYIMQVPTTTAANTITPTANGVVGLTVNGTSGTAATALAISQPGAAAGVTIASANNTATNGLSFSGTFTNLINATNFSVTNAGAITAASTYNTNTFTGSALTFGSAATATVQSAASQALNITGHANSVFSTDAGTLTLQGVTGTTLTTAAGGTSTNVTIKSGDASAGVSGNVEIDTGTHTSGSPSVKIGTNAQTSAVFVGNTTGTNTTTINGGVNGTTPTISLQAATSGYIAVGTANANTIQIGAVGASAFTSTVTIGTSTGAAQNVTIGSNANFNSATIIQGGNSNTAGSEAIRLVPQTTGGIAIGATAGTGTITLGQSTASNTIAIGNAVGAGNTQTIGIGTSTTGTTALTVGSNTTTSTISLQSGNITLGNTTNRGTVTNNGGTFMATLTVNDDSNGGALGGTPAGGLTAAQSVDSYTSIGINQTTAGQAITLPNSASTIGRVLYVTNTGTTSFTINGTTFTTGSTATMFWTGSAWTFAGMDGGSSNYIQNQTATDQAASFKISGTATIKTTNANAFQVQSASGTDTMLNIDTTTGNAIKVGNNTGTGTATTIFVLDSATTSVGLPTTVGAMYYDTTAGRIQCYEGTSWGNCGNTTLQEAYDSSSNGATTPEIKVTSTNSHNGLDVQDADTTLGATAGLFNVRASSVGALGASLFTVQGNGRVGINNGSTSTTPAVSYDLSFGQIAGATTARTIGVETQATAATGGNGLTVSAGTGNTTGVGGTLSLQGGNGGNAAAGGAVFLTGGAAGGGNTNGGSVTIAGGAAAGSGVQGVVNLSTTAFTAAGTVSFAANNTLNTLLTNATNLYSTVPVNATASGLTLTVDLPTITTVGRILYITAVNGSNDFALLLAGTSVNISMKANSTATLIYNGTGWTAAGASSSTTLQAAYDNTLISAGGAELLLNNSTAGGDGLTIRNNTGVKTITGALLEVQTNVGSNLFSVNNNATEYANNGGAESATFTMWPTAPNGGTTATVTRDTTTFATGIASTKVVTTGTATANQGVANTLSATLSANLQYAVSFTVKSGTANSFSTLDVVYSRDGTNASTVSCTTGRTVTASAWTRVTCTFTAPATGETAANAIFIRQSNSNTSGQTFFVDNLSVTVNASVNHAIDGSVDAALGTNWVAIGGSVARDTTTIYDTSGSVAATTSGTAGRGVYNNLTANIIPAVSTQYRVSFYANANSGTATLAAAYTPDNNATTVACQDFNTQVVTAGSWQLITCIITTTATAPVTSQQLRITQTAGAATIFYVDALTMTLSNNNASNVQIGGANKGGPTTLLTLDRASTAPIAANNDAYLGSMYYDTTTGRIQCYEADGWGACGSAPDNIVNLNPEYAGAVLNGTGVGTMTTDFCGNGGGLTVNVALCASGEARNYYKWTSPQATQQTYSIYVTYQLPATFKAFASDATVNLTGRVDDNANAAVTYQMFSSNGATITACGTETDVIGGVGNNNTWMTTPINGNEATGACGFTPGGFVIFKINLKANSGKNAYAGTLSFTTTGK